MTMRIIRIRYGDKVRRECFVSRAWKEHRETEAD
jgi:hypothetical protein